MFSASIKLMCFGSSSLSIKDFTAGYRLSRRSVVFPLPETPLTTVNFPLGMLTSKGLTLCISFVFIFIEPLSKTDSLVDFFLMMISSSLAKNPPIKESPFFSISSIVPSAIIFPPALPADGPISII